MQLTNRKPGSTRGNDANGEHLVVERLLRSETSRIHYWLAYDCLMCADPVTRSQRLLIVALPVEQARPQPRL